MNWSKCLWEKDCSSMKDINHKMNEDKLLSIKVIERHLPCDTEAITCRADAWTREAHMWFYATWRCMAWTIEDSHLLLSRMEKLVLSNAWFRSTQWCHWLDFERVQSSREQHCDATVVSVCSDQKLLILWMPNLICDVAIWGGGLLSWTEEVSCQFYSSAKSCASTLDDSCVLMRQCTHNWYLYGRYGWWRIGASMWLAPNRCYYAFLCSVRSWMHV